MPALLVALAFATACGPGSASGEFGYAGDRGGARAPSPEVTMLTEEHGSEAADCLSLEDEIARLDARLEANEKETFAGLEIVYGPKACAIVYVTGDGEEAVERYVSGSALEDAVRVETREASLHKLGAARVEATRIADDLDVPVDSGINVRRNRVELYPLARTSFEAALREAGVELPDHVAVLGPETRPRPPEGSTPDPDVFLPRQRFGSGGGGMDALIRGRLTLDGKGCLRIRDPESGRDPVPVWPADFGTDNTGGEIRVLNKDNRTVAKVGKDLGIGGGEISNRTLEGNDLMSKPTLRELLARCPGNYWLVATG